MKRIIITLIPFIAFACSTLDIPTTWPTDRPVTVPPEDTIEYLYIPRYTEIPKQISVWERFGEEDMDYYPDFKSYSANIWLGKNKEVLAVKIWDYYDGYFIALRKGFTTDPSSIRNDNLWKDEITKINNIIVDVDLDKEGMPFYQHSMVYYDGHESKMNARVYIVSIKEKYIIMDLQIFSEQGMPLFCAN